MAIPLQLLMIEDSSDDAQLLVRTIEQGGYDIYYERVQTEKELHAALESERWDLILCDYTLPTLNAIRALEIVKASGKDLPFIIASGSISEEMAVAALRAGAHDFVVKDNLARLVPAIRRELEEAEIRRERARIQSALWAAETRYRLLVERMPAIIYVVSSEPPYRTLYISPQVEKILGFSPEEWRADPDLWERQIHPDDRARVLAEDRASRDEDRTFAVEYRALTRDGRVIWLHDETHHIHEPGIEPFSQGFELDITERKRAEEGLREAEVRYRTLVEQLPMVVYTNPVDEPGHTSYVSPQVKNVFGYTPEEWLSDPEFWKNTIHPEDRGLVMEEIRRVNAAGEPFDMEYRAIARDGHVMWIRDQAVRVAGRERQPTQWHGLMIDVTEPKQRAREWEAIAQLSTALRNAQTLNEILPRLLDETLSLLETDQGSIWLHDPVQDVVQLAMQRQWRNEPTKPYPRGENIPDIVIDTGQPIVAHDLHSDPRVPASHRAYIEPGVGGVCVPLTAAGKSIGALLVNIRRPREVGADELRILSALANVGATAIHRAQLFDETVKHLNRLAALRSIDLAISSSFDLKMILNVVLENVTKELNIDAADILLLKADSLMLEFSASKGFWTRAIDSSMLPAMEGLAAPAVLQRTITHIDDLRTKVGTFRRSFLVTDEKFVSYYAVPLLAKGKVKGVLELFHRTPLPRDPEWSQFLESLAGQTAIAIDSTITFQDLQRSNMELALAYDATIEGWSHALDLRDKETEGHTLRVTEAALRLARTMGLGDEALLHLRRGALLHDIGKMGVPDSILLKPGSLTDEEWVIMRKHPVFAYEMIARIDYLKASLDIPYCHHERWDGKGYPRGLAGEQIPLTARMFAVVDVWDALSSDRPYRPAWKSEEVLKYLQDEAGKQFDPEVVAVFLNLMSTEPGRSPAA